jgi:hypothetical protein
MASNQEPNKEIVGIFYLEIDRRKARATTQVITVYK